MAFGEFLRERSGTMISALQNDGKLCFPSSLNGPFSNDGPNRTE